jgi:hypothetical protein
VLPAAEVERAAVPVEQARDQGVRQVVYVAEVIVEQVLGVESAVTEVAVVGIGDDHRRVVRNVLVVMVNVGTVVAFVVIVMVRLAVVMSIAVFPAVTVVATGVILSIAVASILPWRVLVPGVVWDLATLALVPFDPFDAMCCSPVGPLIGRRGGDR